MAVKSSYHWNHDFPKLARESGFIFNTHKPKVCIDWNSIKVIDVDRVIQDRDFITIDEQICQVLDCRLEVDFDVRILDSGFVKLFRLAQLAVEYLLQCRKYLDMAIPVLQAETRDMAEDADHLRRQLRDKEDEIRKLRNKSRRQQKSTGGFRNSDLTNLLKYVSRRDNGDQNANAPFQKCPHCEKAFLNEFYLQSHLARRHSGFPHQNYLHSEIGDRNEDSQSPGHMVGSKFENERLHLEIKELKERLNNTEKIMHTINSYNGRTDIMDRFDKDNEEHLIVVSKSPIRNVDNKEIDNGERGEVDKNDKVEMDCMEKETLTVDVFEKWKKEERVKYSNEIEALKKRLEESIELVTSKGNEREKRAVESDASAERYQQVALALKRQEEEVELLKQQLQEKTTTDFLDVASRLEAQERFWRSKMQAADEENHKSIQDLKSNLLTHLEQAQSAQLLYRKRIDILESSAREQTKTLDDQAMKLSLMADVRRSQQPEIEVTDSHTHNRLTVGESHESLPPYEEGSVKIDYKKPKPSIIKPTVSLSNQRMKTFLKSKSVNLEDESDTSSGSIQIDDKPPPLNINNEMHIKRKDDVGNKTISVSNKKTEKYVPKQLFEESDLSPPKNMRVKSGHQNVDKRLNKSNPDLSGKAPKSSMPRNVSSANTRDTAGSLGMLNDYEDDSSVESGSSSSDDEIVLDGVGSKAKMDSIGRLSRKPSIMEAVKEDLNLIVAKRLEQLGVRPSSKGIAKEVLKKNMAAVRHRRHLVAKEHESFNSIRKDITTIVDEKINGTGDLKRALTAEKPADNIKTSQPLNKLGTILSNVKNKAMSVMRSRDSVKSDDSNKHYALAKLRRESKEAIFDKESYQAIKRVINSGKRSSGQDRRTSLKGDASKLSLSSAKDLSKRKTKQLRNQSDSTSEDSSSQSEDSNNDDNVPRKKNVVSKSDGKQLVVSVMSHTPSTSIENILMSPVRKPGQKTERADVSSSATVSPIKKHELLPKIVQTAGEGLKSYNNEPKNGRMSKSEENLSNMYAGASSSSDESDAENRMSGDIRKSASEDNVNGNMAASKSVLKSVLSTGSLSKKKVLFDLDANQTKSLSASSSVSAAVEVQAKSDWDSRAGQDTESDSDWNLSNIEAEPINHNASIHYSSNETINLSTKQSPKIAELSKTIGAQLSTRPDKPPAGGIETMFQAKSAQNSPLKPNPANAYGGSTTSIASSIFDGNNFASTSNPNNGNSRPQPVARPRTAMPGRNKMMESDLELSDWSIEDLLNVK